MAATVQGALSELIEGGEPTSLAEARPWIERGDPALMARDLLGLAPAERLPARGTARRRRYESAKRQYQRYTTGAGQRRGAAKPSRATAARIIAWAKGRYRAGQLDAMRKRGFRLRVHAYVMPSPPNRNAHPQWLPGGRRPGLLQYLDVEPDYAGPVADAWERGDQGDAADLAIAGMMRSRQPDGGVYWPRQNESVIAEVDEAEAVPA